MRKSHSPKTYQQGKSDRKQTPPPDNPVRGHSDSRWKQRAQSLKRKTSALHYANSSRMSRTCPAEWGFGQSGTRSGQGRICRVGTAHQSCVSFLERRRPAAPQWWAMPTLRISRQPLLLSNGRFCVDDAVFQRDCRRLLDQYRMIAISYDVRLSHLSR